MESDEPLAVVHRRGASGGFGREEYLGLEAVLLLPEIGVELRLADVFERLSF